VVSEETGHISVAAFGEISLGISISELIARINQHFGLQRAPQAPHPEVPASTAVPAHSEHVESERAEKVNLS
jgi:hypothetical protein